jgi:hypothetical protein
MQIPVRRISKFTAKTLVGAAAYASISNTIASHTDLDQDDLTVRVVSGVGCYVVQETLESRTDALVDKVGDKLVSIRTRKTKPETTETL